MRSEIELLYGFGIMDANYKVYKTAKINGKKKIIWTCPFYSKWTSMFKRCYNEKSLAKQPTYKGCSVVPEWHYFMTFRAWMEKQDWQNKHLDKDVLFPGNKIYGPDTCVFVDAKVNLFISERQNHRGQWPIGVHFMKAVGKFQANCKDVITGKRKHLGLYFTPEEAHKAWLTFKLEQAKILADEQKDARVSKALIERYENYSKYFSESA